MYDEPVETSLGATVNVSCPEGYYFAQEEHMGKVEMIMTCDIGGWNVDVLPQCERMLAYLITANLVVVFFFMLFFILVKLILYHHARLPKLTGSMFYI